MHDGELEILVREIYADAVEQVERTKAALREDAAHGDTAMIRVRKEKLLERERAAERIRCVCRRHNFDPAAAE